MSQTRSVLAAVILSIGHRRFVVTLCLSIVLLLCSKLLLIGVPVLLKEILDHLGNHNLAAGTMLIVAAYAGARFGSELLQEIKNWLAVPIMARCARMLTINVHDHLFQLPLKFHIEQRAGELARIIDKSGDAVLTLISQFVFHVIPKFVELGLTVALLWFAYGYFPAMLLLAIIAGYVLVTVKLAGRRVQINKKRNVERRTISSAIAENIQNFEIILAMRSQRARTQALDLSLQQSEATTIVWERNLVIINTVQALIIAVGVFGSLAYAAYKVKNGIYTIGDFVLLNSLIIQIVSQLGNVAAMYRNVSDSLEDINISLDLLGQSIESNCTDEKKTKQNDFSISVNDVFFSYRVGKPTLEKVKFFVPNNSKVAIVGPTGAGKTSIIRILSGLITPTSGSVEIGGRRLTEFSRESISEIISVVPQEITLFNGSIGENIRSGKSDATDDEVIAAARDAQLTTFLEQLPDGLETKVGDRGLKLSGGERQRIALARAIIRKSNIVILDEATSALDTGTEAAIKDALNRIQGVTLVVIAHRLSSIVDFDQIVVLDRGRVSENGTHLDLLKKNGIYAKMWRRQVATDNEEQFKIETNLQL